LLHPAPLALHSFPTRRSSDLRDPRQDGPHAGHGTRPLQGRDGRMARADVGVLLTGVGKRYDIVSAFAEHAFTIACDPNPLAPAQDRKSTRLNSSHGSISYAVF